MKRLLNSIVRGMKKIPLTVYAILVLGVLPALAAGVYTNGFPTVFPAGTTGNQTINGQSIGRGYTVLPLTGSELIPADTQLANGQAPQTEAISVAQLKLFANPLSTVTAATTAGGTITVDTTLSDLYTLTLTASSQLGTPSNLTAGKTWRVFVNQDGTGSRTLAYATTLYTWPCFGNSTANWNNPATCTANTAPVLSVTAGAVDLLQFTYDGSKIRGQYLFNFK